MKSGLSPRLIQATPQDLPSIQALLASVQGDDRDLRPQEFLVLRGGRGRLVGCARLKRHSDSLELASLAVVEPLRGGGLGSALVEALLARARGEAVYLVCRAETAPFFRRFGFLEVPAGEAPASLQEKYGFCSDTVPESLRVMRKGL